jgi:hypothetical protein
MTGEVIQLAQPTLEQLAAKIVDRWLDLDKADDRVLRGRLAIGKLLIDAKAMVKHGDWEDWFKANIPARSLRDARQMMMMAGAPDPDAALDKERARAREGMQRTREAKRRNVTPFSDIEPADPELEDTRFTAFAAWFAALPGDTQCGLLLALRKIHAPHHAKDDKTI